MFSHPKAVPPIKLFMILSMFCISDMNRTGRIFLAQEYLTNPLLISNRYVSFDMIISYGNTGLVVWMG